jgi:SpoVK/Ycf46/Vps4 family AAA+-type ATPase
MLAVDGMERNAAPRATCEGIRSFTSLPATSFYLSESHEDIGEPRDMGGPDDLWLPSELAAILEDARTWSRGRTWYQAHRLPWRRGYLIYGLPGTGKTSLARAIGMDLDLPIYAIDLPSMNNRELSDAFTAARSDAPCMLLFEDFDAVHNGRLPRQPNQQLGTPPSFDLLLNQIQGIGTNDGIMVIITTNHLDAIDHALGGPARVDVDGNVTVGESHSRPGRIDRICRTPDTIDSAGRRMLAARMLPNADMDALLAETEGQTPAQFQDELLTRAQATL